MSRAQRKMYRRGRGQVLLRRVLLFLTALIVLAGLATRLKDGGLQMEPLHAPTPTPITAGFDETVETREITLAAETWYGLQTGLFSSRQAAEEKADDYADRGAPGYVLPDGEKFRVLIACYGAEGDASAVRTRLNEQQGMDVYLHTWVNPTLALRLTGMAGQLDVAEAGLALITQAAAQLRDGAILIDKGQTTLAEAAQGLREMNQQMQLWRQTAKQRFSKPYPLLMEELLTAMDVWDGLFGEMDDATTLTALSAAMKTSGMAMFDQAVQMRAALNEA